MSRETLNNYNYFYQSEAQPKFAMNSKDTSNHIDKKAGVFLPA